MSITFLHIDNNFVNCLSGFRTYKKKAAFIAAFKEKFKKIINIKLLKDLYIRYDF